MSLAQMFLAALESELRPAYTELFVSEMFAREFPYVYDAIEGGVPVPNCASTLTHRFVQQRLAHLRVREAQVAHTLSIIERNRVAA